MLPSGGRSSSSSSASSSCCAAALACASRNIACSSAVASRSKGSSGAVGCSCSLSEHSEHSEASPSCPSSLACSTRSAGTGTQQFAQPCPPTISASVGWLREAVRDCTDRSQTARHQRPQPLVLTSLCIHRAAQPNASAPQACSAGRLPSRASLPHSASKNRSSKPGEAAVLRTTAAKASSRQSTHVPLHIAMHSAHAPLCKLVAAPPHKLVSSRPRLAIVCCSPHRGDSNLCTSLHTARSVVRSSASKSATTRSKQMAWRRRGRARSRLRRQARGRDG